MRVNISVNDEELNRIGEMAVGKYVNAHKHECFYCHKKVALSADVPRNAVPVCAECTAKRG